MDSKIIYDSKKQVHYYYNPSLSNIGNKHTDYPSISLFTGCGGLDLGLEKAGFSLKAYVENNKDCIETIKKNRKNWVLVKDGDITKIEPQDILENINLYPRDLALISGGAPCQPFSNLGKNEGENNDKGQLYKYFIKAVKTFKPAAFIFENVRGMLQNHIKVIEFMKNEFECLGYGLSVSLLCAADYGVPQKRYRVFIIGRRDGKTPGFPFPSHAENPEKTLTYYNNLCSKYEIQFPYKTLDKWVTVRETFNKLTPEHYQREDSIHANLDPKIIEMINFIKPGTRMCWKDLPDNLKFDCWKKGGFKGKDNFGRIQFDEAAVTIRTGAVYPAKGRYIHPEINRALDTIEMAALQSFPLELEREQGWFFHGGIISIARQIGNAVPPLLAEKIGRCLLDQVKEVQQA